MQHLDLLDFTSCSGALATGIVEDCGQIRVKFVWTSAFHAAYIFGLHWVHLEFPNGLVIIVPALPASKCYSKSRFK